MHSDLDPLILFLFCLFAICKISQLYYYHSLFARCQHYNANGFRDEPDFNIVYQFNFAN